MEEQEAKESAIPKITDEEYDRLNRRIKPVVEINNRLYWIEAILPWAPKLPASPARFLKPIHTGRILVRKQNPCLRDVFSQIPNQYKKEVIAFQTPTNTIIEAGKHGEYYTVKIIFYSKNEGRPQLEQAFAQLELEGALT